MNRDLSPRPGARTAHEVKVQVVHFLAAFAPGIGDDAKAPIGIGVAAVLNGQLVHEQHHAAQQSLVFGLHVGERNDVRLGDDQQVNRRPGVDVVKHQDLVVLVHLARGDVTGNDFAKYTIHGSHLSS